MKTDDLERQLRSALRETLDQEAGPDPAWAESPAARRVAALDRNRRRWPLRLLAVAAVIGAAGGAALLTGAPHQPAAYSNGRIAYTVLHADPAGGDPDTDIWLTALDEQPRRVIGSDTDGVVPVLSQVWGRVLHVAHGDHLDVVGQYGALGTEGDPDDRSWGGDWLPSASGFDRAAFETLWSKVADFIVESSTLGKQRAKPDTESREDPDSVSAQDRRSLELFS